MWRLPISFALSFVLAALGLDCGVVSAEPPKTPTTIPSTEPRADVPTYGRKYAIAGLPQHDYTFDAVYEHGKLQPLECAGTVGFVIEPNGEADPQRRWVWISNLFLATHYKKRGDVAHRYYIEALLARGFHIAGVDVGTSCGSPAGAKVYDQFYRLVRDKYRLHAKTRLIGQSNGGLIAYGFAFRYPDRVDRILGICPATDLASWPGLHRLIDTARFTPAGLSFGLTKDEWSERLAEFNPIDNLAPLARAGVKLHHIHGTHDDLVPLDPNSAELARRYKALGGDIQIETIDKGTHGGPHAAFFQSRQALDFLLQ